MDPYTREEKARLTRARARQDLLSCPRCGGAMDERAVPPRSDVAYVRNRAWLMCRVCGRTLVVDRSRDV